MPLAPGQVLQNRYRIVKLLGQGGFGAVYRAWDLNMKAACAVKENLDTTPASQKQFEREAKLLFQLHHPNLPRVYDHFLVTGQGQYLVMDFVDGQDLADLVAKNGPISESQVLSWIEQVCNALGYMHSQNPPVIHRDIKPSNIIINQQGTAMLVDFGIAKLFSAISKTSSGAQAVTPGYSPLEQYGQGLTDSRSDVYALGATLYMLLTGQIPQEVTKRALRDDLAQSIQNDPHLATNLRIVLLQALEIDPNRRYPDASIFFTALSGVIQIPPTQPAPAPTYTAPPQVTNRSSRRLLLGVLITSILTMIGLILAWNGYTSNRSFQILQDTTTAEMLSILRTSTALAAFLTGSPTSTSPPITVTPTIEQDTPPPNPGIGSTMIWEKDGMKMVFVPAGSFLMGSNQGEQLTSDDIPQRTVEMNAFWIDQHEVTNAQYAKCVVDGDCLPPTNMGSYTRTTYYNDIQYAEFPVVYISWNDADSYCRWAGRRLPGEGEWEKAARGTDGRFFPWGNQPPTCDLLNYNNCVGDTTAVGSYPAGASPYGVLDMSGNVLEWISDWYIVKEIDSSVHGYTKGSRGGMWGNEWDGVGAVSSYVGMNPEDSDYAIGFRCVFSP